MNKIEIDDIKVLECHAGGMPLFRKLKKGDTFIVESSDNAKIGDAYGGNPYAIITRIYYEPRKWWQFWKKKRQIGFQVTWTME